MFITSITNATEFQIQQNANAPNFINIEYNPSHKTREVIFHEEFSWKHHWSNMSWCKKKLRETTCARGVLDTLCTEAIRDSISASSQERGPDLKAASEGNGLVLSGSAKDTSEQRWSSGQVSVLLASYRYSSESARSWARFSNWGKIQLRQNLYERNDYKVTVVRSLLSRFYCALWVQLEQTERDLS